MYVFGICHSLQQQQEQEQEKEQPVQSSVQVEESMTVWGHWQTEGGDRRSVRG